jgi:hypothetical protein
MFGSGSLRRNGVVEPDVPNTAEASTTPTQTNEEAGSTPGNDETWIFYIVSAVLPEGHPLLSAPSLFTDNPTYEDMLFLDSFLQKPVASRNDLAAARGLYRIHQRSNGDLYASGQEEVEDTIEIATERCLICLSDFEENEEVRRLVKCAHFFHRECVDTVGCPEVSQGLFLNTHVLPVAYRRTQLLSAVPWGRCREKALLKTYNRRSFLHSGVLAQSDLDPFAVKPVSPAIACSLLTAHPSYLSHSQ